MFIDEESRFHVTFSAGIMMVNHSHTTNQRLIDDVDKALYESKTSGRNQTTIYSRKSTPLYERKLHIMIIDQDKMFRNKLKNAFNEWQLNYKVSLNVNAYSDGHEFLKTDWYEPNEKYLFFRDGMDKHSDSVDTLTKIRRNYPEENIVISMLTSHSKEEDIVQALIKGADDYMFKTFNFKEIMPRTEKLLKRMRL